MTATRNLGSGARLKIPNPDIYPTKPMLDTTGKTEDNEKAATVSKKIFGVKTEKNVDLVRPLSQRMGSWVQRLQNIRVSVHKTCISAQLLVWIICT